MFLKDYLYRLDEEMDNFFNVAEEILQRIVGQAILVLSWNNFKI